MLHSSLNSIGKCHTSCPWDCFSLAVPDPAPLDSNIFATWWHHYAITPRAQNGLCLLPFPYPQSLLGRGWGWIPLVILFWCFWVLKSLLLPFQGLIDGWLHVHCAKAAGQPTTERGTPKPQNNDICIEISIWLRWNNFFKFCLFCLFCFVAS